MEVSRFLSLERTEVCQAVFCRTEPLKALLYDGSVLPMVVGVHLHVRSADVALQTHDQTSVRLNSEPTLSQPRFKQ